MREIKNQVVPEHTIEVVSKVVCDLCGEEIKREKFSAEEVIIKYTKGESYPDCGNGEDIEVDMCGKCFDEKLAPWLISQGAKLEATYWSW
mgnify:CR=1 FL=1